MAQITEWIFKIGKDTISPTLDKINKKFDTLDAYSNKAERGINSMLTKTSNGFKRLHRSVVNDIDDISSRLPLLGNAIDLFGSNKLVQLTAASVAAGAALGKATVFAAGFDKSMANINVTAQLTQTELKALEGDILKIGRKSFTPLEDVPEAFNKIISAGLDVPQSLKALEPTLRAAKAGFTDVKTTAAAAVATMQSAGETDIVKVYDVLFATLNKGNAEFRDIAQYLPKIIPGANNLGVSLEDVAGSFAFLTAQGQTAEQSTTGLTNAFKALGESKKQVALKKVFDIEVFDKQTGKFKGMLPIIEQMKKGLDGLSDAEKTLKLEAIGFDMEASMAFATLTQNTEKLKGTLDFVKNSSGELAVAFKNSSNATDNWNRTLNNTKAIGLKVGAAVLPIVNFGLEKVNQGFEFLFKIGGKVNNTLQFLNKNMDIVIGGTIALTSAFVGLNLQTAILYSQSLAGLIVNIGRTATGLSVLTARTIFATSVTKVVTAAQWAWNAAMNANPIGILITGVGALVGGMVIAYKRSETFKASIAGVFGVIKKLVPLLMSVGKIYAGLWTFNPAKMKEGFNAATNIVKDFANGGITDAFNSAFDKSIAASRKKADELNIKAMTGDNVAFPKNNKDFGKKAPNVSNASSVLEQLYSTGKNPLDIAKENKKKGNGTTTKSMSSDIVGVSSDKRAARNVTVNIGKLVENITIQTNNQQLSSTDLRRQIEQIIVGAVRDAEIVVSN